MELLDRPELPDRELLHDVASSYLQFNPPADQRVLQKAALLLALDGIRTDQVRELVVGIIKNDDIVQTRKEAMKVSNSRLICATDEPNRAGIISLTIF